MSWSLLTDVKLLRLVDLKRRASRRTSSSSSRTRRRSRWSAASERSAASGSRAAAPSSPSRKIPGTAVATRTGTSVWRILLLIDACEKINRNFLVPNLFTEAYQKITRFGPFTPWNNYLGVGVYTSESLTCTFSLHVVFVSLVQDFLLDHVGLGKTGAVLESGVGVGTAVLALE